MSIASKKHEHHQFYYVPTTFRIQIHSVHLGTFGHTKDQSDPFVLKTCYTVVTLHFIKVKLKAYSRLHSRYVLFERGVKLSSQNALSPTGIYDSVAIMITPLPTLTFQSVTCFGFQVLICGLSGPGGHF